MKQTQDLISHPANDNINVRDDSSKHASKNYRRRGIQNDAANAVLIHGDITSYRGNGVTLFQISKKKLRTMGGRTPEGVQTDRLRNLFLLVSNDNIVVTALRPRRGKYKAGRKVEG